MRRDSGSGTLARAMTTPTALARIKDEAHLKFISQIDGATLLIQPRDTIGSALAALSRYDIKSITTEQMELEDEFMKFYEDGQ